MIAFDLKCDKHHVFEAWFGSSADYESQVSRGLIACPICDSTSVTKAIMAPNIGRKSNQPKAVAPAVPAEVAPSPTPAAEPAKASVPVAKPGPELPAEVTEKLTTMMTQLRKKVEENCDYVGKEFAEEARKIHYGETEERGIYGEASLEEAEELYEEGIDIAALPLPGKPRGYDA
ncbi:MAG: DUF1178 family protein [Pseudomonadota bacterium]